MTTSKTNIKFAKQTNHSSAISPTVDSTINITSRPTITRCLLSVAVASSLLLVGCDDDDDSSVTYSATSQSVETFSNSQIDAELSEAETAGLGNTSTPAAKCGVTVEKVSYPTKGSAGEQTNATAALMLPSGDAAECQGDRPVLLYAHGTTTEKTYDFAQVGNNQNPAGANATLIAANFAAQGYIVVAPNYAGYDNSDLDYHPYLDANQQSFDMVTALDSARSIIKQQQSANNSKYINVNDSGKLFIAGYSQGGHVVMATARLLEQQNKPVTAIAPSSGPYALAAFGDAIFTGNVNIGATAFAPLLATGLQKAYGNIYQNPMEIFTPQYADTKLPNVLSFEALINNKKLPANALFQTPPTNNPVIDQLPESELPFASAGFDSVNYLINTEFRAKYVADAVQNPDGLVPTLVTGMPAVNPQNNLRKALKANDLRGYVPTMPTLICGGNQDPTVFYDLNTGSMTALLQGASEQNPAAKLNVTVLDVDVTNKAKRQDKLDLTIIGQASMNSWNVQTVANSVQANFADRVEQVISNAVQQGNSPDVAFLSSYHGGLVNTACNQATREFFNQEFAQL
ncbi:alpha/beta hydrolase family protein [Psychrobacter frigidicola]|uniref:alpha/beta hydrolase family protein n=1 Tax=Psychrobacter frigidicola TaxID=45611 RepID=UPI001918160F|nr:dienelactone hydrolase family protein [Psychrobacter frigidicola]